MSEKKSFLDLLGESVIMQGTITILVLGVWLAIMLISMLTKQPEPASFGTLTNVVGIVIGFFFGGKYAALAYKVSQSMKSQKPDVS